MSRFYISTTPRFCLSLLVVGSLTAGSIWTVYSANATGVTLLPVPAAASTLSLDDDPAKPIYDTEGGDPAERLSAQDAAAAFDTPPGFHVTPFASEPEVRQPIAVASDRKGRLWVVENYTYAEASVNFDLELLDRIVVLEDTDADGVADQRTLFWDQGKRVTSVEIGHGGVWVLAAPELLFFPDADEDLVPDGPPVVLLDGWDGGGVRHNIVNGLRWGPDGWLYGRHGILATSLVGTPGTPAERRTPINCGVWRYHPTEARFEVVAHGTTNPWGMDWNAEGELLLINTVIGHLWHVVPGVHFERMYGNDFDPHLYQLMPQIADHIHWNPAEKWSDIRNGISETTDKAGGGHAHSGLLIYQEQNWPQEFRDEVYAINLHGRRLNRDHLELDRAGLVARHRPDLFQSADPWFRGVELIAGPDGQVWIADWSDTGECHENDGVSRSSGRIYELRYGSLADRAARPTWPSTPDGLVDLAIDGPSWWSRQARLALAGWSSNETDQAVRDAVVAHGWDRLRAAVDPIARVRALWALNAVRRLTSDELIGLMSDDVPVVRRWAIRLAVDQNNLDAALVNAIQERCSEETDGLSLLGLASALQRIPLESRLPMATVLSLQPLAGEDERLRLMIWYGVQHAVAADPAAAVASLSEVSHSDLRSRIVRRLASDLSSQPELGTLLLQAIDSKSDSSLTRDVLVGLRDGTRGLSRLEPPAGWSEWVSSLDATRDETTRLALAEVNAVFGEGRSAEGLMALAGDGSLDPAVRAQALESLGRARSQEGTTYLLDRVVDRDLGAAAVAALRQVDDSRVVARLVEAWDAMRPEARVAALGTLTARAESAGVLLKAIADGRIPADVVGPYEWRQISALGSSDLEKQVAELWPDSTRVFDDRAAKERLEGRLTEELLAKGNAEAGHELFAKVCGNCHKLFGEGAAIGPDLTGSQRGNLAYLIENIGAPSAEVATGFRTSLIQLLDGQVVVGVIVKQLPDRIEVQTKDAVQVIERRDIDEVVPSGRSLMPDGLVEPLNDQQLADLFAYLRT